MICDLCKKRIKKEQSMWYIGKYLNGIVHSVPVHGHCYNYIVLGVKD